MVNRTCLLVILAVLSLAAMPVAHSDSSARIMETHPSAGATFGRNESLYVRIAYATDGPINLWARPYRDAINGSSRVRPCNCAGRTHSRRASLVPSGFILIMLGLGLAGISVWKWRGGWWITPACASS